MRIRLWGTRGSVASPGADTVRYGGNTACVEVRTESALLVLDAGTGIRPLGVQLRDYSGRIDLLLTHLHLDHLQGLGFFEPCFRPDVELHVWGPASTNADLGERMARYLSPPLFPVRLRDLGSRVVLHDVPREPFQVGDAVVHGRPVIHPGPTVGYRIEDASGSVAYLPDHEPALGSPRSRWPPDWTSGHELAAGADVLLHDAQYTSDEYSDPGRLGPQLYRHAWAFAVQSEVGRIFTFHHDPSHDDDCSTVWSPSCRPARVRPWSAAARAWSSWVSRRSLRRSPRCARRDPGTQRCGCPRPVHRSVQDLTPRDRRSATMASTSSTSMENCILEPASGPATTAGAISCGAWLTARRLITVLPKLKTAESGPRSGRAGRRHAGRTRAQRPGPPRTG